MVGRGTIADGVMQDYVSRHCLSVYLCAISQKSNVLKVKGPVPEPESRQAL